MAKSVFLQEFILPGYLLKEYIYVYRKRKLLAKIIPDAAPILQTYL